MVGAFSFVHTAHTEGVSARQRVGLTPCELYGVQDRGARDSQQRRRCQLTAEEDFA
jgi:hypothetical protein